jgi:predicted GIY-YIG superfamily endonuclease
MSWFIYLLFCDSSNYYVGLTGNLPQRIKSHSQKKNVATKEFNNFELVYFEEFKTRNEAEKREKQIKGWSRAKKKALAEGNIELLKQLSKNHGYDECRREF